MSATGGQGHREETLYSETYVRRLRDERDDWIRKHAARLADLYELEASVERLRSALEELVSAGEPFVAQKRPVGLRILNRWLAAMNDARSALGSSSVSQGPEGTER